MPQSSIRTPSAKFTNPSPSQSHFVSLLPSFTVSHQLLSITTRLAQHPQSSLSASRTHLASRLHISGYFGDPLALPKGDCRSCGCNPVGTLQLEGESDGPYLCDQLSGQCSCKPFVAGDKCERCVTGYWNILSGEVGGWWPPPSMCTVPG